MRRIDDPAIVERRREQLRRTWEQCVPLDHTQARAVRTYLESRALGDVLRSPPAALRAHPGLTCWDGARDLGRYPAMVALFCGADGVPVTVHVTYLQSDGYTKAAVPVPQRTLSAPKPGATKGGAIRLYPPRNGVLGIAAGIESALSLHLIRRIPVRCADNLEQIRLPGNLRRLEIGVNVDASGKGQRLAEWIAQRMRKFSPRTTTYLVMPEVEGPGDLNDELRRRAYGRR